MTFTVSVRSTLLAAAATLVTTLAQAVPSQVLSFGDSLADTGNVQARFAAFGIDLPADPYFDGRFTNGLVAVEVLANELNVPLVSLGYGGALTGTDNRITIGGVLSGTGVQSQINNYVASQNGSVDSSGLYVVWAGGNDFFSAPAASTIQTAVTNLLADVSLLYAAGARDFLVPNLPDLSTTAEAMKQSAQVQFGLKQLTLAFNSTLSASFAQLQGQLAGSNILVFDTYGLMTGVRNDYVARGLDVTTPCWSGNYTGQGTLCANAADHYLWDSVHPTEAIHAVVGQSFASAINAVPEPEAYVMSIVGLLALGAAMRRRAA